MTAALEAGYRHIDTASVYNTEAEVGEAIKASGVPREEIFLTTKLHNTDHARVPEAFEESLQRLQTDYVDLYLIHWPCSVDPKDGSKTLPDWDYIKTWQEMQKLPATGKVRSIGVSNFTRQQLERLLNDALCTTVPAVNQIEIHPCYPSRKLVAYNTSRGIHSTAYACLGSTNSPLYKNEALNEIAKARGKSMQQIILRWDLHKGISVIPKSVTPERIRQNFELDGWALTRLEMESIDSIQERFKACGDKHLPEGVQVFTGEDDWEAAPEPVEEDQKRYDSAAASVDMEPSASEKED